MKLSRTITPHDCATTAMHDEYATSDIVEYPDDHPVVMYLRADRSVISMTVLIEDGTKITYVELG